MKRFIMPGRRITTLIVIIAFLARLTIPAYAVAPVKLKKFLGTVEFNATGVSTFTLEGSASHLGRFSASGEIEFTPGETEGTLIGHGVAVFEAANGDLLVADVTWEVEEGDGEFRTSAIHFSWRDFIELADGTIIANTGRFVDTRPPGLVVIAIIAVLIGLLLPAV